MQAMSGPSTRKAKSVAADRAVPEEVAARSRRTQRRLLALAASAALLTVLMLVADANRELTGSPWQASQVSWWDRFTRPYEVDAWQRSLASGHPMDFRTLAVHRDQVVVGGDAGALLESGDAGNTWAASSIAGAATIVSLAVNGPTLLAVDANGALWQRNAALWERVDKGTAALRAVALSPRGDEATVVGDRVSFQLTRQGDRWMQHGLPPPRVMSSGIEVRGLTLVGDPGPKAFRPPDVQQKASPTPPVQARSAPEPPADPVLFYVAYTDRGLVAGGPEGTYQVSPMTGRWAVNTIFREHATQVMVGYVGLAIADGTLYHKLGASEWKTAPGVPREVMQAFAVSPDGRTALAVGRDGVVLRSDNSGRTWLPAATGSRASLQAVTFGSEPNVAFAAGAAGLLLRSIDAGRKWTPVGHYARYPAPWVALAASLLLLATAGLAWYLHTLHPDQARTGLLDNGVSDQPISTAAQDRLSFGPAVDALAVFLRHSATTPPLAIAVNAPWGTGKTSFMGMLVDRLRDEGAHPVWFNVWHHQHEDPVLAPLLNAITRQAVPGLWEWQGWRFRARLVMRRLRNMNWASALGFLGLLAVPAYVACLALRSSQAPAQRFHVGVADRFVRDMHALFDFSLGGQWFTAAKSGGVLDVAAAGLGALRSDPTNAYWLLATIALLVCSYMAWSYLVRPFPANPAILVARLNSRFSLSQAEAKTDFRERFQQHFGDVAHALAPRTLTLFIDDLDRCQPQKAAELLEAVNYLCDAGPCYVVLGMARELVEAQVASAHKALAEEQAVLQRARQPADTESGAPSPDKDRLAYARKYLRKLVQLDVHLPTADETQALRLLLQRPGDPGPATRPQPPRWRRTLDGAARCLAPASVAALLLAFATTVGLQTPQTWKAMDDELAATQGELEQQLQNVQATLRETRTFEQWLRLQNPSVDRVPSYKAHADMVAGYVKGMEAALPGLQKEARDGHKRALDKLMQATYSPHAQAAQKLRTDYAWTEPRLEAIALPGLPGAVATIDAPRPPPASVAAPTGQAEVVPLAQPAWPYLLATLPAVLLLLLAASYRDRYVVQPTAEYQEAVRQWQKTLLPNPETGSPRELKRFMNVSRYVVARREASWPLKPSISEATIVEFTARWMQVRAAGGKLAPYQLTSANASAARLQEAEWFLRVVGDMGG